jgi:hypothetical protein
MSDPSTEAYSALNKALLSAQPRAKLERGSLTPHVELPALSPQLTVPSSQLVFGRQGTGKTHLLLNLQREAAALGYLPVFVDLGNVGVASDLHTEPPVSELPNRATRLAVDLLGSVHAAVHRQTVEAGEMDEAIATHLDALGDAITEVRVSGPEERSQSLESARSESEGLNWGLEVSPGSLGAKVGKDRADGASEKLETAIIQRGHADVWLHLGSVVEALEGIAGSGRPLLVLIDEWNSAPLSLQPWLADLIRRIFWDTSGCTVKIAAVLAESRFINNTDAGLVGLNPSHASTLNLDWASEAQEYRSDRFVAELLFAHATHATLSSTRREELPADAGEFGRAAFQPGALTMLIEAAEGNPRDAILLGARAATLAKDAPIAEADLLEATRVLLTEYKELDALETDLALWFMRDVLSSGRSRCFYAHRRVGIVPELLRRMHSARLVHKGEGILREVEENDWSQLYEEWHVDYSVAAYLLEGMGTQATVETPPPALPYDSIDGAPILRDEEFERTRTWRIEPHGGLAGISNVTQAWAKGPPEWVRNVAASLPPDGDFLIVDAGASVEPVPLERSPLYIGRGKSTADLCILHASVSRRHAVLLKNGETWRLIDQESTNGVFVNGERRPWWELSQGDVIIIGSIAMYFVSAEADART